MSRYIIANRAELPKIYSRELMDVLFEQPYCRVANSVDARIVKRQAASEAPHDADAGDECLRALWLATGASTKPENQFAAQGFCPVPGELDGRIGLALLGLSHCLLGTPQLVGELLLSPPGFLT